MKTSCRPSRSTTDTSNIGASSFDGDSAGDTMSKVVLRAGIVASALLVLSLGIIMGLRFPDYVFQKNLQDLCILTDNHSKYGVWVNDSYRDRYNRIYYWELTNKYSFLYERAHPKLTLRGPYVYRERQQKMNVRFIGNRVTFYVRREQQFEAEMTRKECGENCSEDDQITVFNDHYLKMVGTVNGDVMLALRQTPVTVASAFFHFAPARSELQTFARNLGRLSTYNLQWSALDEATLFPRLSFGQWVVKNDSATKRQVLEYRHHADFTSVEILGLFNAVTHAQILHDFHENSSVNETFVNSCLLLNVSDVNQLEEYLQYSEIQPCDFAGLIYWHFVLNTANRDAGLLEAIQGAIAKLLCVNASTTACMHLPSKADDISRRAYVLLIVEYVIQHLLPFVMHAIITSSKQDVVTTRKQSHLSLGFYTNIKKATDTFVPGILQNGVSVEATEKRHHEVSLFNCYDAIYAKTNFMWDAYESNKQSSLLQFPRASLRSRRVFGFRENLPPEVRLSTCRSHKLSADNYTIFVPQYWRSLLFSPSATLPSPSYNHLQRLYQSASNLRIDSEFVDVAGMQEMTGTNGYASWISAPHFLGAHANLAREFDMSPRQNKHGSYVDVEPITGAMWNKVIRYQHNVAIRPSYVQVARAYPLSIGYFDKPLPVYWLDETAVYNEEGIADYNHRIKRLLRLSCGGLISFSILATIVLLFGMLAATVAIPSRRVAPSNDRTSIRSADRNLRAKARHSLC